MRRVCIVAFILSIVGCISSPEVTLVDDTDAAPVSRDEPAQSIALVEDLGLDGGNDARDATTRVVDGGVLPHPERDAEPDAADDDDSGAKGKPPKKQKP